MLLNGGGWRWEERQVWRQLKIQEAVYVRPNPRQRHGPTAKTGRLRILWEERGKEPWLKSRCELSECGRGTEFTGTPPEESDSPPGCQGSHCTKVELRSNAAQSGRSLSPGLLLGLGPVVVPRQITLPQW